MLEKFKLDPSAKVKTLSKGERAKAELLTALDSQFHSGALTFETEEIERLTDIMNTVSTIVGIYLDRAAVIPEIAENCEVLIANFGTTDSVVLELIRGEFAPTGRLPFEIPSSMAAVEKQFEYVPFDSIDPLFPFGDGLTYDIHDSSGADNG